MRVQKGPELESMVRAMFETAGEDPEREGLIDTPRRYSEAIKFLSSGYTQDPQTILKKALFKAENNGLVVVKHIEFYSLCEHHLLPFFGQCHVAYIPDKKIVGLSKIPRVVDCFSRRFQVQERLTRQIAESINDALKPRGVCVMLQAKHFCMMMRGVEKQNSETTTFLSLGACDEASVKQSFLHAISSSMRL